MTSAAGASELDAPARQVLRGAGGEIDRRSMGLAARLASLILNPVVYFDESRCSIGPLPPAVVRKLAMERAFGRPINRALSKEMALGSINLDPALFERLPLQSRSRLALVLVTAPPGELAAAAILIAVSAMHKRIVGLVMKADRHRFRTVIGDAYFEIATREVPMLFGALSELDRGDAVWNSAFAGDDEHLRLSFMRYGLQILCRFLDSVEPDVAQLFVLRQPERMHLEARKDSVAAFSETHIDQLTKLVRRRMDPWTDIIG